MYWNISTLWLYGALNRLTLTWDVLKWMKCFTIQLIQIGLTLTWDVLKLCGKQQLNWHIYD